MANTTVSIRERIKTADGRWQWSPKIPIPQGKLSPSEAARKGVFYLVWTENGEKQEQPVEERRFEAAVKAARTKERYLEDVADGFNRPDPLKIAERKVIAEAIKRRVQSIEISKEPDTLKLTDRHFTSLRHGASETTRSESSWMRSTMTRLWNFETGQ